MTDFDLQPLVVEILNSHKYRRLGIPPETVEDLLAHELGRNRSQKEAIKETRKKLHNIVAPYLGDPDFTKAEIELERAVGSQDPEEMKATCASLLSQHASTRERLPILEQFYQRIFKETGKPDSILDLACGLNPLSFPWMGLPCSVHYYAYDLNRPRLALIHSFFALLGMQPGGEARDILLAPPVEKAQVAFFFKEAHRFEQRQKGCNLAFWQALNVRYLLVSLPTASLSGKHNLLAQQRRLVYETLRGQLWQVTELLFDGEIVFCIDKMGSRMTRRKNKASEANVSLKNVVDGPEKYRPILSEEDYARLEASLLKPLEPALRINPLKVDVGLALEDWKDRYTWQVRSVPYCDTGWWVPHSPTPISQTIEHRLGFYYIQDAASMLPVELFNWQAAVRPIVLDMAASPGGKTTHLVSKTADQGLVIANNSSRSRITALRLVLQTWGAASSVVTSFPGEKLGIGSQKPLISPAGYALQHAQPAQHRKAIRCGLYSQKTRQPGCTSGAPAGGAFLALKPGGQVVYSTCTLAPEEDEGVLQALLDRFPGAGQGRKRPGHRHIPVPAPGLSSYGEYNF